jgi:tripeptidyl-peptidase-1
MNAYFATNPAASPGFNRFGRGFPDVSLIGTAYLTIIGGGSYLLYGTSCSSPVLAGMISLVNTERKRRGMSSVGFINPTLYANTLRYTDVTQGSINCCQYGGSNPATNAQCCAGAGFSAQAGAARLSSSFFDLLLHSR